MTNHVWSRQFLFEGLAPTEKDPNGKPPVESWVTCTVCGAQVCQRGWGSSASTVYRVDSESEWTDTEPKCRKAPTIRVPIPGWIEQPNGSWRWSNKKAKK